MDLEIILCKPALLSTLFGLAFVIYDLSGGLVYSGIVRLFITISIAITLQLLCQNNMKWMSWSLLLIPLIFYFIMAIIVYIMVNQTEEDRLKEETKCRHKCQYCGKIRTCICAYKHKACNIC